YNRRNDGEATEKLRGEGDRVSDGSGGSDGGGGGSSGGSELRPHQMGVTPSRFPAGSVWPDVIGSRVEPLVAMMDA
ncbi:hypothetical protein V1478_002513, partial [Vespula squamosa]